MPQTKVEKFETLTNGLFWKRRNNREGYKKIKQKVSNLKTVAQTNRPVHMHPVRKKNRRERNRDLPERGDSCGREQIE